MTGLVDQGEFSRRSFLKGGGALIVGFSILGPGQASAARAAVSPFASNGSPDLGQVDSFVAIHGDNTASILTGRVELGQGSATGLLVLAAEELDMGVDQLEFVRHDTNVTPNTGITAGSSSIRRGGLWVRSAAATARQALLGMASTSLGVPVGSLSVSRGVVSGGGKSVSYGQLIGGRLFHVAMASPQILPGVAPAKPVSAYTLVGITDVPRIDIPAKVTGTYTYVQNIRVPGMLHGRIVRPRGQGAYGAGTRTAIVSVDASSIRHIPGARIVRRNDFLGVVAPKEWDAIQAAAQLKVAYAPPPAVSGSGNLFEQMRAFDNQGKAPASIEASTGDVDAALASAAHTVSATYKYPYQAHVSVGPSCAVADVTPNGALVFGNTQDAYAVRSKLQPLLNLPLHQIRVQYWEGSGSYGNAPARYDTSLAAAVMSQLAGAPVRLQFMRWDENGWDNYGPATMVDLRGGVDPRGKILALDYTGFQIPFMSTDPTTQHVGFPLDPPGLGTADLTNSGTQYAIPNRRVTAKSLPLINNYFKTHTLRAPGAPQACFAEEQLIDELAHAAGMDPYLFRLQNITSAKVNDGYGQWHDALVAVGKLADWQPRVAASSLSKDTLVSGRGIALGGYANSQTGVVAHIQVNRKTGKITPKRLYTAQIAGLTVYPGGVSNQMEGNLVMATSRALVEEVAFNTHRVTGLDWATYPILRFKDSPAVTTTIVQRTDLAPTGSGEPPTAPTAAAIANAFFDATGVRIREAPMTPARVRAVLEAAEAA